MAQTNNTNEFVHAHRYREGEDPVTGQPMKTHVGTVVVAPGEEFPEDVDLDRLDPEVTRERDDEEEEFQAAGPGQFAYFDPQKPDEHPGDLPASLASADTGTQQGVIGTPLEDLTVAQLRAELDSAAQQGVDAGNYTQSEKKADLIDRLREVRGLLGRPQEGPSTDEIDA